MKIPLIKKINTEYKRFYAENLNSVAGINIDCTCDKSGIIKPYAKDAFFYGRLPFSCKKLYYVNEHTVYAVAEDECMYRVDMEGVKKISNSDYRACPTVMRITHGGQNKVLIVSNAGFAELVSEDGSVEKYFIPVGSSCAMYNGMLFIANANTLYFSTQYNFSDFTMSLDRAGVVKIKEEDGDILSIIVQNNKLVVFTQYAVYEFTAFGDRVDYTLKKVETDIPDVIYGTVKDCGKKIFFMSGTKICSYENGKINVCARLESKYSYAGNLTAVFDGNYCVPVHSNGKTYLYCVDVNTEKMNCLINVYTSSVSDYGYTADTDGYIRKIVDYGHGTWEYDCAVMNFFTAKEKVIHEISVFCDKKCTLNLIGDYGQKSYILKKGANALRVNLPSRSFKLNFSGEDENRITDLRIKYRIKGE